MRATLVCRPPRKRLLREIDLSGVLGKRYSFQRDCSCPMRMHLRKACLGVKQKRILWVRADVGWVCHLELPLLGLSPGSR